MQRTLPILRWALALATIAVILALCWQAIDIYHLGNSPANRTEAGLLLQPMYRWEDVAARLRALSPLFWGYGALAAATLLLQAIAEPEKAHASRQKARKSPNRAAAGPADAGSFRSRKGLSRARIALYALAFIMVVWGVMNGGLRDVLVKAINICTECIGLG